MPIGMMCETNKIKLSIEWCT